MGRVFRFREDSPVHGEIREALYKYKQWRGFENRWIHFLHQFDNFCFAYYELALRLYILPAKMKIKHIEMFRGYHVTPQNTVGSFIRQIFKPLRENTRKVSSLTRPEVLRFRV